MVENDDNWSPDDKATTDPRHYRVDSWEESILGNLI